MSNCFSAMSNPLLLWTELAFDASEMLVASAQVINHRTGRMALAGPMPSERDQKEFALMSQEKIDAASESMQAMTNRTLKMTQQFSAIVMRQIWSSVADMTSMACARDLRHSKSLQNKLLRDAISNSVATSNHLAEGWRRVADTGLKPIHSRATANARRLSRVRLAPPG